MFLSNLGQNSYGIELQQDFTHVGSSVQLFAKFCTNFLVNNLHKSDEDPPAQPLSPNCFLTSVMLGISLL